MWPHLLQTNLSRLSPSGIFLTNSAEPCGKVDESFAAETMKQPGTIKLFTVPDDKTTILNRKEAKDHMKLGAAPKFIKNADINRLTMLKLNGPFPINAISTFTEMRDQYYKHKELNEPELHIDTFFKDNAQDLLESLSVEDALMYFKFDLIKKKLFFQNPSRFKQF